MRFGHLELFVSDPMASKRFYEDALGFEVEAVQQETFVWLRSGEVEILLRPGTPPESPATYQAAAGAIVLYTDELGPTSETLVKNGVTIEGVDGSETCLTFRDPDGHWFQLVEHPASGE